MKSLSLAAVVAALLFSITPTAYAQLGVAGGLNFEQLSDIEVGDLRTTVEDANGYHFGVFFDTEVGPIGLRLGAFYRDLGEFGIGELGSYDLTMLEFPIDVRIGVIPIPLINPYLFLGPVVSIPDSGNEEFQEALENYNVAGNVGIGFGIRMGGMTLMPELRYAVGISRFTKDTFELAGQTFSTETDQTLDTVQLRLGLRF